MPRSMSRIGSSAAREERAASPAGLVGALLLHAGIIAAAFVTWSHRLDLPDQSPPVIPVDLVTVGQKTNIAPMVREKPPEPAKQEMEAPPAPQPKQAVAPPQEEAPPSPPEKSAPAPQIVKAPPILPKFRPQPEEKKEKFDINNIMALLDKRAPSARQAPNGKLGSRSVRGFGAQTAMTLDLVDALRNQIAQCWSPPVGAPHPDQLIVSFELFLNPDGSVAQPPQLIGSSAASGDPFMRAAAEAARRAIYTCAPYKLPGDRFAQWRDITLTFDPRQMVGQ